MDLCRNIAKLRKKAGLTQEKLAELCGVSRQAVTKWESGESEPAIEKIALLSEVFNVSIDELIKGSGVSKLMEDNQLNVLEEKIDMDMLISLCISSLSRLYDYESFRDQGQRYYILEDLYKAIRNHYVDHEGNILEKYLVANTTKSHRLAEVTCLNGPIRCPFQPFKEYVEGHIEITGAIDEMIREFQKKSEAERDVFQAKHDTAVGKLFIKLDAIIGEVIDCDDYSDRKLEEIKEGVLAAIEGIQVDSVATNSLLFFASEYVKAVSNKDNTRLKQLAEEWWDMHESIWRLI